MTLPDKANIVYLFVTRPVQIFQSTMVGVDNHHVDEACGLKKKRLFNLLNCLLLAEKEPATMTKLEEAFFEVCVESNKS